MTFKFGGLERSNPRSLGFQMNVSHKLDQISMTLISHRNVIYGLSYGVILDHVTFWTNLHQVHVYIYIDHNVSYYGSEDHFKFNIYLMAGKLQGHWPYF